MKSYTDLEQSKKLAEILPLESADFMWEYNPDKETYWDKPTMIPIDSYIFVNDIPCWSLAALLRELPDTMLGKDKDGYVVMVETMGSGLTAFASNPIDACYEMIIKLHEQKLL